MEPSETCYRAWPLELVIYNSSVGRKKYIGHIKLLHTDREVTRVSAADIEKLIKMLQAGLSQFQNP